MPAMPSAELVLMLVAAFLGGYAKALTTMGYALVSCPSRLSSSSRPPSSRWRCRSGSATW
ncbi:MAG: hypothetical protein U5K43_10085 [Halofilum sp. (in: g-proteobacteria)]|nr:hypothetical protein [Halofilum sp. (in: g-proteobacteria)]